MAKYDSKEYRVRLEIGEVEGEEDIRRFLNSFSEYEGIKYISYDEEGNITWQQIETNFGRKRHPDFLVNETRFGNTILLVEVKYMSVEYSNSHGILNDIPYNDTDLYLVAEKVKIDDYVFVQAHYETECKIVFVVGRNDSERRYYWQTLDKLENSIIAEGYPYGKKGSHCYIWKIESFNDSLFDLLPI